MSYNIISLGYRQVLIKMGKADSSGQQAFIARSAASRSNSSVSDVSYAQSIYIYVKSTGAYPPFLVTSHRLHVQGTFWLKDPKG
jgi:hypothetical protein